MTFAQEILNWYKANKRDLPWRTTQNPYNIWLSEIILQQTRVVQGTPYYLKFIKQYPTVYDLAKASEDEVLKLWQGLGYYSRARNLHTAAKTIVSKYKGIFPQTYQSLLDLKGVGDYTASAIASICFNEAQPVVDGNVYRVLARYFGKELPINSSQGIAYFKTLAREVMDATNISSYNQGIMEFGALQCTPKKPNCMYCQLNEQCIAFQTGKVFELPVKLKKIKAKTRYFNYLVFIDRQHKMLLRQRKGKGIWQNLYEFPLLESKDVLDQKAVSSNLKAYINIESLSAIYKHNQTPIIHKLTHQHLHTFFWIIKVDDNLAEGVSVHEAEQYPVPVLIADFLETFKKSYF